MSSDEELHIFCQNIKSYRKEKALSKTKMAKKLKIGLRTLDALENGCMPPRLSSAVFFRFSSLCGIPLTSIFKQQK